MKYIGNREHPINTITRYYAGDNSHDVDYFFNEYGYRYDGSDKWYDNNLVVIGDSFTFGLGLNIEDTWSHKLSEKLNCNLINLSQGSCSNEYIYNTLKRELPKIKNVKCVIVYFTYHHRFDFIEEPGGPWNSKWKKLITLIGEEKLKSMSENFIESTKILLKDIPNFLCSVEDSKHLDNKIRLTYDDYSNNKTHPGKESNDIFFKKIYEVIKNV
tara:strand:+ start:64 stop:705 length:642 start_codon:yes stop_codon:yes gene_type:complete